MFMNIYKRTSNSSRPSNRVKKVTVDVEKPDAAERIDCFRITIQNKKK
jgi:hypothetical protein